MEFVPDGLLFCRVGHLVANVHQLTQGHLLVWSISGTYSDFILVVVVIAGLAVVAVVVFPASVPISFLFLSLLLFLFASLPMDFIMLNSRLGKGQ